MGLMTISGLPIYPPYNNNAQLTWTVCEVDKWLDIKKKY